MKLFPSFPKVGKIPLYKPTQESIVCTIIIAALMVFLYAIYGNWMITAFSLSAITLKYWLIKKNIILNKYLLVCLLFIALILLITLFGGYNGRQASLGLLTLLLSLKVLESKGTRDYSVTCLLMYFVSAVIFAYEDSSAAVFILLASCLLITSCLAMLSQPDQRHSLIPVSKQKSATLHHKHWLVKTLKENSKILLQALPLTIILFFLFPRIQGNFGFLPGDDIGKSGLENEMAAGEFSRNAFSNELAFRAEFNGKLPENKNLYWRSKVFDVESNFTWKRGEYSIKKSTKSAQDLKNTTPVNYKVIHQATRDVKLPVLEKLQSSSVGVLMDDYTLLNKQRGTGAFEYQATSNLQVQTHPLQPIDFKRYLQTSFNPGKKTIELLEKWRRQSPDTPSLVKQILEHFNQQPFKYNLRPPSLSSKNPAEEFLFETRSGYCEHYASVFTLLMRWSGIPSRVVVGYQGGEWVEEGNFLEVRYSDAHAWSEVWLEGAGWKRVDPTFAIAPERIEFGMDALFALWERDQIGIGVSASKLADMLRAQGINQAWQKFGKLYRSYGHRWDKWIVNFNYDRQMEILKKLKIEGGNTIFKLLALLFTSSIILIALLLYYLSPKKIPKPLVDQYYQDFLNKLASNQIRIGKAEGPLDFALRASELLPNNKADIHKITQYYVGLKYDYRNFNLQSLKNSVKKFKLQH